VEMMTANDKKRNKGWARLTLCFIICLGTLPLAAEGKLTLSPYLDYSYSNNIFWNSSSIGDTTVSPGLGLGFTTPSFNFFLNADGKIYRNNAQMNSSMFSGGFSFYQMLSRRSSLFFSPELSLIQFQGDMAAMNTLIPGLTVGLKHMFSDHLFGRLGLNLRHSNYLNEDSYDRLRLGAFWEISTFFRTQTTIRLTLGVNYLLFPHITSMLAEVTGPVAPLAVTTASQPVPIILVGATPIPPLPSLLLRRCPRCRRPPLLPRRPLVNRLRSPRRRRPWFPRPSTWPFRNRISP